MASKKAIIAERRAMGVTEADVKRGLDGKFIRGTALTGAAERVKFKDANGRLRRGTAAEALAAQKDREKSPPAKDTIGSLRDQLFSEQERNWFLTRKLDEEQRQRRRLQVQLDAVTEALLDRSANQATPDDFIPF